MHPAFSVIFLTTLIGVGQGLFLALYTGQIYSVLKVLPGQDSQTFYAYGSGVALIFLVLGLFASFFHLGHPERAWRSAAQWRTSWLSREVIVLPITMLFVFLYGLMHYFGWDPIVGRIGPVTLSLSVIVGFLAALACFVLFICTGMIYACIKFLQEWASPLTVVNYMLLGSASGFTLATLFSHYTQQNIQIEAPNDLTSFYAIWSIILISVALITRIASLVRNHQLRPKSTLQTAIGVRHAKIQQKSQGFMGGAFNTRDFFHHQSVNFLRSIKWLFLVLAFAVPIILLGLSIQQGSLTILLAAFIVQYVGLLFERWYFFAQANHPQNLYYQTIS